MESEVPLQVSGAVEKIHLRRRRALKQIAQYGWESRLKLANGARRSMSKRQHYE